MRIFSGGIPFMRARERLPKIEVQPKKSTLTMAKMVSPFSITIALTNKSPLFSFTGFGVPMPPEMGKRGLGVRILLAAPTIKGWLYATKGRTNSQIMNTGRREFEIFM
jgi:hypothetical protein